MENNTRCRFVTWWLIEKNKLRCSRKKLLISYDYLQQFLFFDIMRYLKCDHFCSLKTRYCQKYSDINRVIIKEEFYIYIHQSNNRKKKTKLNIFIFFRRTYLVYNFIMRSNICWDPNLWFPRKSSFSIGRTKHRNGSVFGLVESFWQSRSYYPPGEIGKVWC